MSFRVDRRFNLLILEEGEEYVADVSATMALVRRGKTAESKGRLRIGSKSLVFQPDEVSASILKFPYRYLKSIGVEDASDFPIECEQFVQVATKLVGTKTRIVTPFSISKAKISVNFHVLYADAGEYLRMIRRLWEAASLSMGAADGVVKEILTEATLNVHFDMSRLGHRESALLPKYLWVRRVKPLLQVRGMLQTSNEAIYFQPHPNFASKPVKRVGLGDVLHVFRRTYGVQANALEIITVHGRCLYLCFETQGECDRVATILQEQRRSFGAGGGGPGPPPRPGDASDILHNIHRITALWQSGVLSNFHYLDFLNCASGRSQNDFSQYPVFPWVLKDYTSERLELGDPAVYRDLTKPIGALSSKRLEYLKERMTGMPAEEQFLYGTHYSTPAYVIYWLLRAMPERMLRLHNGHFDAWPRLFRSVLESWESVNESTTSLMELIPEFFVLPATWLENTLGIVTAEGPFADVQLPLWAKDLSDFVCKMRAALESDWTSRHLPAWIDLIFGHKQSGEEAVKADNLFHPVCYMGSTRDDIARDHLGQTTAAAPPVPELPTLALETQLQEFGRVPRRLFLEAHPPRLKMPQWEPDRLREDPMQSEPWYKVIRQISGSGGDVEALSAPSVEPSCSTPTSPAGAAAGATGSSTTAGGDTGRGGAGALPPSRGEVTTKVLQALCPRAVESLEASGRITGVASCPVNLYSIGEDGCLRVGTLPAAAVGEPESGLEELSMRRNFRISPMPLSALAVLRTDLLTIGGHDNAVTLYSSACGSALAKCQSHGDTVTCLSVSPSGITLVSGSRDQSVRIWQLTPSSLKSEATFDDIQQPITCATAGRSLVLAGAEDGQLMAWDTRSGQAVLDREMGGEVVACALHDGECLTAALDATGEFRLFDLRHRCESVRLPVVARSGGCLSVASCFLTDFAGWAVLGGLSVCQTPALALWDIPEQREVRTWEPSTRDNAEVRYLVRPQHRGGALEVAFLCASATGAVHVFSRQPQSNGAVPSKR